MRILGIDYGRRRIGIAVSDTSGFLASPRDPLLRSRSLEKDLKSICRFLDEEDIEIIVVGLPLNMDGTRGEMAREAEAFAARLHEIADRPVDLFDERLTSSEAERVLLEADVSRRKRKSLRDGLAATLILQGFLDRRRNAESAPRDPS